MICIHKNIHKLITLCFRNRDVRSTLLFQTKRVGDGGWLPEPGPQGPQQDWSGRPTGVDRILKL